MKKRLVRVFVLVLMLAALIPVNMPHPAAAEAEWLDGWAYRRKLMFNNGDAGEALQAHRVLVTLDSQRIEYSQVQPQGQDIRFTSDNGVSTLPYQIVQWRQGEQGDLSYLYVQVPEIPATHAGYIYMYYGNPQAPPGQNPDGTWSSTYRGVWTLDETTRIFRDSSASTLQDPWGSFGTPVNLGYPAVLQPVPVGSFGRYKNQITTAVYDYRRNMTYVVFPGGTLTQEEQEALAGEGGGELPMPEPDMDPAGDDSLEQPMSPMDPYITAYNHATGTWATPVKVGEAYDPPDTHYYPVITVTYDAGDPYKDKINVFQGGHNQTQAEDHYIRRYWRYAYEGIAGTWEDGRAIPGTQNNTYPAVFQAPNGNLYLFFRRTASGPPITPGLDCEDSQLWYEPEDYVVSTNGGENWSLGRRLIDPLPNADEWGTIYVKAMRYTPAAGPMPAGIHMLYGLHYRHNCKLDKEYYAFFALESNGNYLAERLYAADGQLLAAPPNQPVTRAVFDSPSACPSCRVYSEGPLNAYATRTAIDTFVYYDEGIGQTVVRPVVFYNFGGAGTVRWQYFDGTGWQSPACDALPSLPGGGGPQLPFEVTAHPGTLELYVTGYRWGFKQPRILKWRLPSGADGCHGGTWEPADVMWGVGELPGISFFNFVQDAKADGSLTATFFEMNTTSIDHPNAVGKLYGWGNAGAVKASGYAQDMTSPVGPAVHFDAGAQTDPQREDDNIHIGHTSAFAFTNQIAVEAVVQFDGSNPPTRDEFVLGKHSPLAMRHFFGFNLWYDHTVQNMRWDIGNGFNDLSLYRGTVLASGWHYVVATLSPTEQTLWIDGLETSQLTGSFVPDWDGGGPWDLRLGARTEGVSGQNDTLDGALGYVAIRNTVPSDAYIWASWKNMIVGNFVVYCPRQQAGQGEPSCLG